MWAKVAQLEDMMQQDMQDKAKLRERLLEAEQSLLVISK